MIKPYTELIEYKHEKKRFAQNDIAHDFHKIDRRGNLDNVHPLLRWANGLCLVDEEKKEITDKVEKFVDIAEKLGTCYIHYSFGLKDNVDWNILVHILSNQPRAQNVSFEDIEKYLDRIPDSPAITGIQLYHNYLRPHSSLNNDTPSNRSGIKIEGKNKWTTIIQNATKNKK